MNYKNIIAKMSIDEKAALMSGKDFWTTVNIDHLGIPSIFLSDGPHGLRKQALSTDHLGLNVGIPSTCFPTSATVANSWDPTLGEEMAKYLGKEAVALKVHVLLGPGTNIKRNPLCGRNFEYFSEDPLLAGKMSAAYIRGIQSNGISACLKHFAANNQEFRRMAINSIIDERTLREIYLKPFEIGIKEGNLKALMSSYNMVNGFYTNENIHLMKDILRDEWGFEGVVVTDWGGSNDHIKGLIAGNSLEMPSNSFQTSKEILEAIKNKDIDEAVLDENVDRLLTLIFDTDKAIVNNDISFDVENHHLFAQRVAEESMVLLKNENDLLPLNKIDKIAVIGDFAQKPRYQGAGSSIVNPTKLDNTVSVINEYEINYVGFEPGYKRYGKKSNKLINRALKLAKKADVILLYLGLDEFSEVEGMDRKNMKIPANQLELFNRLNKLNKKIVIVLSCGSAIEMDFADSANAILHTYLSGQAGAKAVLNVLTGRVNPNGKLSETIPYKYEDTPNSKIFPGKELTAEYREGLFVGYRYYDSVNIKPRYPFGYGMSYTNFDYSDLIASKDEACFKITNTGKVDGKEIAQVYVRAINSKVYRPNKELKGFIKLEIKVGETIEARVKLGEKAFEFFNPDTNKWEIEKLTYEVIVAASSQDERLKGRIMIDGVDLEPQVNLAEIPSYKNGEIRDVDTKEFAKILNRDVPKSTFNFYKKHRLVIDYNTTVEQLRYSKRWIGRAFSAGVRFSIKFFKFIGKRESANILEMGVIHLPIRGLSRMSGGAINWGQLDGLIMMFNGNFFKGLSKFFKEKKTGLKNGNREK
ncbi:MAG: glycoside hydrolase family 3 C-terminal domain-containing protein [Candidatus Izemoplasmatales bacterium]